MAGAGLGRRSGYRRSLHSLSTVHRLDLYREHAQRLLDEGKAYLCFCTEAELQKEREQALSEQRQAIYSGKCRMIDPGEASRRQAAREAAAIRLRIPEHPLRFHDIV